MSKKKYNILYLSQFTTEKTYHEIIENKYMNSQQVVKFHNLILKGFAQNKKNVCAISAIPLSYKQKSKRIINMPDETMDDYIHIKYLPIFKLKLLKNIIYFIYTFIYILKKRVKKAETYIFLDILSVSQSISAVFLSKIIKKVKLIGIVTDLPKHQTASNNRLTLKINNYIMKNMNYYIFLTEDMNDFINKSKKPYYVMEGLVNNNEIKEFEHQKYDKFTFHYAGSLNKKNKIDYLVQAFLRSSLNDAELHIYGSGDYSEELIKISSVNNNVKYFGVKPNKDVLIAQKKSHILVNPRFSNQEFTRYSFPSKLMEYLNSEVPILTTKLPGIPKSYYEYFNFIETESIEGFCLELKQIYETNYNQLELKAKKGKEYVSKNKNSKVQIKNILLWLHSM